mmetsp:Transcript_26049/g.59923  ORF Transcript_26049/g.59923 Transcript_26049/m.59923 type:complete len:205 (-) Transcript_26049:582-1196(-)
MVSSGGSVSTYWEAREVAGLTLSGALLVRLTLVRASLSLWVLLSFDDDDTPSSEEDLEVFRDDGCLRRLPFRDDGCRFMPPPPPLLREDVFFLDFDLEGDDDDDDLAAASSTDVLFGMDLERNEVARCGFSFLLLLLLLPLLVVVGLSAPFRFFFGFITLVPSSFHANKSMSDSSKSVVLVEAPFCWRIFCPSRFISGRLGFWK